MILCSDDTKDGDLASDIFENLSDHRIEVKMDLGWPEQEYHEVLQACSWFVIILSKEAKESKEFCRGLQQVLQFCVTNNKIKMLPVLRDLLPSEVPPIISWVTLLEDNKHLQENLLAVIKGKV